MADIEQTEGCAEMAVPVVVYWQIPVSALVLGFFAFWRVGPSAQVFDASRKPVVHARISSVAGLVPVGTLKNFEQEPLVQM